MSANKTKRAGLLRTEDWLAVWIGFIIIAIGIFAVSRSNGMLSSCCFTTGVFNPPWNTNMISERNL